MKRLMGVLLLLCLLGGLGACGRDKTIGRDFAYPVDHIPQRLDPQIASGTTEDIVLLAAMEGLVRLDAGGVPAPGVAESWESSADGLTYTFHLRADAAWYTNAKFYSNQSAEFWEKFDARVTADDFVFALRRAVTPAIASPLAEKLDGIANASLIRAGQKKPDTLGVQAVDAQTLRITLTQPDAEFLPSLAFAPFYPCNEKFYRQTNGRYGLDPTYLLCNGPFYLSKWQEGVASLVLRKNTAYAGQAATLPASVTLQVDSNRANYAARLEAGLYSLCPLAEGESSGSDVIRVQNRVDALVFNCDVGLLKDATVRQALAGALDLSALPDSARPSAAGLIPESALLNNEPYRAEVGGADFVQLSRADAKKTLSAALRTAGQSTLELQVLCTAADENTVRVMLQQWNAAFGLLVRTGVQVLDAATLQTRAAQGDFAAAIVPLTLRGHSTHSFLAQFVGESPQNYGAFSSAQYEKLLGELRRARPGKPALTAAQKAENFLLQNGVLVPLFAGESVYAAGKGVSGVHFALGAVPDFRAGRIKD
ncbi:MAG: peptide ABC transporter substrate-binding protein [Oscillospiraceae bacterium]|jgi:oligopeptide transport system substrate-binding protein|nr:peptide ABC transporter substrate-binding protein [Oscillospiraceae bacterium]